VEEHKEAELELPKGLHFFADTKLGYIGNLALDYLKERMIDEKYINEMGYIYDANSEYNNRIFIPFFEDNKLVYYICRDFTGTSYLRYANPHNINSKNFVYNIDNLQDTLFICEGVFDAISIRNIVGTAILSANLGEIQAKKIMERAPKTIIIVPDNDETGSKTLDDNVRMLIKYMPPSLSTQFFIYNIEGAKDLNNRLTKLGKDVIDIEECVPYQESKKMSLKPAKKAMMKV
jgi:DNA primase